MIIGHGKTRTTIDKLEVGQCFSTDPDDPIEEVQMFLGVERDEYYGSNNYRCLLLVNRCVNCLDGYNYVYVRSINCELVD